jgi:NitT/TauT family transport system substrate-binding protein
MARLIGQLKLAEGGNRMTSLDKIARGRRLASGTVAAGAFTALTVLAAGCTSTQAGAAGLEKTSIVVGAVPSADSAGLYIAEQQGFFTAVGLHVKVVPIVSAEAAVGGQLRGTYDVTLGNYVSYIEADAEQHADLRIIAEGSVIQPGNQEIATLPGSKIRTLTGLRKATLAVNVLNNIGTILIGSALQEYGLRLSDVKLKAIPFPLMIAALQDHQVDAAWLPEPFLSSAGQQIGATGIYDLDQGSNTSFPIIGYAFTRTWEEKYPRTAAAFRQALERGQALADKSRADVERSIGTFVKVPPQTAALIALPQFPLGVDRLRLQRVADAMLRFGLLKKPFNVAQMIG